MGVLHVDSTFVDTEGEISPGEAMIYVSQSMMRAMVTAFGVWPVGGHFIIVPDPKSYEMIVPSLLEFLRN